MADYPTIEDPYKVIERLRATITTQAAELEWLTEQLEAAVAYAGLLSIEVGDIIGLAQAHGFADWPSHQPVGDRLRAILHLEADEITAAGNAALAPAAEEETPDVDATS